MRLRIPLFALCVALGVTSTATAPARRAHAVDAGSCVRASLYDGVHATLPDAQHLAYHTFGGATSQELRARSSVLNSIEALGDRAGYFTITEQDLDAQRGFQVDLTARVHRESHQRDERAGFSLIVIAASGQGIELGFWPDRIWAQDDERGVGLFRPAEVAAYDTASTSSRYTLSVRQNRYALSVNGRELLKGTLRDYRAFEGFPDPYEAPNFVFAGDNTTSAGAVVEIAAMSIRTGRCR